MTIKDILVLTGASKATVYRWMSDRDFPRSGRDGKWSRRAVEAWWNTNKGTVGRWPKK